MRVRAIHAGDLPVESHPERPQALPSRLLKHNGAAERARGAGEHRHDSLVIAAELAAPMPLQLCLCDQAALRKRAIGLRPHPALRFAGHHIGQEEGDRIVGQRFRFAVGGRQRVQGHCGIAPQERRAVSLAGDAVWLRRPGNARAGPGPELSTRTRLLRAETFSRVETPHSGSTPTQHPWPAATGADRRACDSSRSGRRAPPDRHTPARDRTSK